MKDTNRLRAKVQKTEIYEKNGFAKPGVYTIVVESAGAAKRGKLNSGAGWISLDYAKMV